MRPEAVLFDCDGVLVDSEPLTDEVIIANLSRYGLEISEDEVTDLFLGGTLAGVGEKARERGAVLPEDWLDEIYSETFDRLREGTPPIEGITDVIERLDFLGIPYGVGSNGPRNKMEITLGQNGLWDKFKDMMASAHDGLPAKPAPDIYASLAKRMGVDPARAVVIDDSAAGIGGALAAGIPAIGFAQRTPAGRLEALGVPTVRSMSQLADMIGLWDDSNRELSKG